MNKIKITEQQYSLIQENAKQEKILRLIDKNFNKKGMRLSIHTLSTYLGIDRNMGDKILNQYLNQLEVFMGTLYLGGSKITTIPSLKSVGGFLSLSYSEITSLPSLKSVGGSLFLEFSKVTSIPVLENIGGELIMTKSRMGREDFKDVEVKGDIHE